MVAFWNAFTAVVKTKNKNKLSFDTVTVYANGAYCSVTNDVRWRHVQRISQYSYIFFFYIPFFRAERCYWKFSIFPFCSFFSRTVYKTPLLSIFADESSKTCKTESDYLRPPPPRDITVVITLYLYYTSSLQAWNLNITAQQFFST